jgi:hypothetical protein
MFVNHHDTVRVTSHIKAIQSHGFMYMQVGQWSSQAFNTVNSTNQATWTDFVSVTGGVAFTLPQGAHTLTLCVDAGDPNIDWIE